MVWVGEISARNVMSKLWVAGKLRKCVYFFINLTVLNNLRKFVSQKKSNKLLKI